MLILTPLTVIVNFIGNRNTPFFCLVTYSNINILFCNKCVAVDLVQFFLAVA